MSICEPGPTASGFLTTGAGAPGVNFEILIDISSVPVGHLIVLFVSCRSSSVPVDNPAPQNPGWIRLYAPFDVNEAPLHGVLSLCHTAWFKVKEAGDSDILISRPQRSNYACTWRYLSWSNARPDFPIDNVVIAQMGVRNDANGEKYVFYSLRANTEKSAHLLQAFCEEGTPRVSSATGVFRSSYFDRLWVGGNLPVQEHVMAYVERQAAISEHYNLMPFNDVLNENAAAGMGWSLFNMISEGLQQTGFLPGRSWRFSPTGSNTEHYIHVSVPLVAGVTYIWSLRAFHQRTGNMTYCEVVPPTAPVFGNYFDMGENSSFETREVIGAGFESLFVIAGEGYGAATDAPHTMEMIFTPTEDGMHTFRIGTATTAVPPVRVFAGSVSDDIEVASSILMEYNGQRGGDAMSNVPTPVVSGHTARMRPPRLVGQNPFSSGGGAAMMVAFEVVHKNGAVRRAVAVSDADDQHSAMTIEDDGISTRLEQNWYPVGAGYRPVMFSRPIYPYNAIPSHPTKYYFEVSVPVSHADGSGGNDLFVGVKEVINHLANSQINPLASSDGTIGLYSYRYDGDVAVSTTNVATGPVWQVGDVFGVLIDMAASQITFTRNGSFVATVTMRRNDVMLVPAMYSWDSGPSNPRRWRMVPNLTGPFTYPQAADVSPYDWLTDGPPEPVENQLTLPDGDEEVEGQIVVAANLPEIRPAINIHARSTSVVRKQ